MRSWYLIVLSCLCFVPLTAGRLSGQDELSYSQHVAPVLTKYCAGCHNAEDREGEFSLHTWSALDAGTSAGPVVVPGQPAQSRLLQIINGEVEPSMPPEGEPAPSAAEIRLIREWIRAGAHRGQPTSRTRLPAPRLMAASPAHHYVGAACMAGSRLIVGKLGRVEALNTDTEQTEWIAAELAGKINCLRLSPNGQLLVAGGGVTGVSGEIVLLDSQSGELVSRFVGHQDSVYCAALSPDGKWLASGGYDRQVILWNVASGERVAEFSGHNGAIYDLDFHPGSEVLASASADQTVKLWTIPEGQRLDTLGQPEGEMRCVRFTRDGKSILAAGADRQIRKWSLIATDRPSISPMLVTRYAHEADVLQLRLLDDDYLISCSDDQTVKLWTIDQLEPCGPIAQLQEAPVAVCLSPASEGAVWGRVVDLKGAVTPLKRAALKQAQQSHLQRREPASEIAASSVDSGADMTTHRAEDTEPNQTLKQAVAVQLPVTVAGKIAPEDESQPAAPGFADVDLFHFQADAGQTWVIEVTAASQDSPLDSRIDVLDDQGQPVLRTRLQAVLESYFTFRGKDSSTSDDFRMHKWEDMELDEFLYSSGEVTRLWHYPRGPDSGFRVYPGAGKRHTFFGTTPVSHALGEPAYIVRELAPGMEALPNGLPVFPIYYENDDDPLRRRGKDSRLTFTAPRTGDYYLRIRDARGFGGDAYAYQLDIRAPQPDFELSVSGQELKVPPGSGREWKVSANRIDGWDGPISVSLEGLPAGVIATNPLIIEAGQQSALGVVYATASAAVTPSSDAQDEGETESSGQPIRLTARGHINGQEVVRELEQTLQLSIVELDELRLKLVDAEDDTRELDELSIRPGQTVSAKVLVQRNGFTARIGFGKDDSGRNLPHGAFVDNIGLNGLLITEQQSEREFFITAAPKVTPGRRQFHLRSETKGNPCSAPIWLNVLPAAQP